MKKIDYAGVEDPKGLMNLRFKCPLCGSSYFSTSNALSDNARGHCNGYTKGGKGCSYTWDRKTEDSAVFVQKGQTDENGAR